MKLSRPWREPVDIAVPEDLQARLPDAPLVATILARRSLSNHQQVETVLSAAGYQPAPPGEFPDMPRAVARIAQAVHQHERICIWGDFDTDGQTSTTLLVQGLSELGADVIFYIPDRATESHGIHIPSLQKQIERGASLVVSCDTGIADHAGVDYAKSCGIDLIITDHHVLPPVLPGADAIINPHLLPDGHPLSALPGVGVAYKLLEALFLEFQVPGQLEKYLDLVAIGIIADVATLSADTWYLARRGLEVLRSTDRLGLKTLFTLADIDPAGINEEHIGFSIGPRLNALGRLADANRAVEFFTTTDPQRARELAIELEALNAQRQLLSEQVYLSARKLLEIDPVRLDEAVLVLSHPRWPAGIVGIVASRLAEEFDRPVVLLSNPDNAVARGSVRSVQPVNIIQAISETKDLLETFGGHAMAAGLSIKAENIPVFRKKLSALVEKQRPTAQANGTKLDIDAYLDFTQITLDLAASLEKLAPFGPGNPNVVLASKDVTIARQRLVGRKKEHLLITVQDQAGKQQKTLFWQGANTSLPQGLFDLAYSVRSATFRGEKDVQVEWLGFRQAEANIPAPQKLLETDWQDYRSETFPLPRLMAIKQQVPDLVIWSEAVELKLEGVYHRNNLPAARDLAIWTIPPDHQVLQAALEQSRPGKVYLFAVNPGTDAPDKFIHRLVGLVKYAASKNDGAANLSRLAAACAQSESAVWAGLDYLGVRGLIDFQLLPRGELGVQMIKKPSPASSDLLASTEARLHAVLAETKAFREHYRRVHVSKMV